METKLKIILELEKNHDGIHLRKLSRLVKSGLPNIKRFVDVLEKEKVIRKKKDANLLKIFLRGGPKTISYLKQLNTEKFLLLPTKIQNSISEFLNELEEKPLIALVFGSYSKGDYNKNSDIDLLLVFQKVNSSDVDNTTTKINMRTNVQLSPVYLDYKNFEKNFLNKEHDFSKEIRNNVIILRGLENYYDLLWRFLR